MALVGTALLTILGAASVSAASNAAPVPNDIPATAANITSAAQTVSANGSLWYKFYYNANRDDQSGRTPAYVTLPNGALNGLGFEIFTPSQVGAWWDTAPIGRGTAQLLNNNGLPNATGPNSSPDLTWVGKFGESGTYYVRVTNSNNAPVMFTLSAWGQDVSFP